MDNQTQTVIPPAPPGGDPAPHGEKLLALLRRLDDCLTLGVIVDRLAEEN
jgi:hypothetical protein